MTKVPFGVALGLMLVIHVVPATADQLDECMRGCEPPLASCIDQARLNAGNVQEEQDLIAACENSKIDCRRSCEGEPPLTPPQEKSPEQPTDKPQS